MLSKQEIIDKFYNGNAEAYEKDLDNCWGESTSWSDLEVAANIVPKNSKAYVWIEEVIGYLPPAHAYMPYISFVHSLIENEERGVISNKEFISEMYDFLERIRNDDMKKGGWAKEIGYGPEALETYNTYLSMYKQAARNRLSKYLGYEPELKYSLQAELYLRQYFECEGFNADTPFGRMDLKAITIEQYRQAFVLRGEASADNIELTGLVWRQLNPSSKPITFNLK